VFPASWAEDAYNRLKNLNPIPGEVRVSISLTYQKTFDEIRAKAAEKILKVQAETDAKVQKLTEKIQVRLKRIMEVRRQYDIDDVAMADLFRQARQRDRRDLSNATLSYVASVAVNAGAAYGSLHSTEQKTVGIGVVENLLTESDQIDVEKREIESVKVQAKGEIESLEFIVRNLRPITVVHEHVTWALAQEERNWADLSEHQLKYLGF
jgi:hypothetical protein